MALDNALAELNPETTERELARNIESLMIEYGALNAAYPPIVAAGKNSALPHARPSNQRILDTNLLLVDVGANFEGYCSDMTRMIPLSKLSKEIAVFTGAKPNLAEQAAQTVKADLASEMVYELSLIHI